MDDPEVLAALQRDAAAAHLQARAAASRLSAACTTIGHALEQAAEDLSEALRLLRRRGETQDRIALRLEALAGTNDPTPPAETPAPVSQGPQGE
jgi:hypothetical protein